MRAERSAVVVVHSSIQRLARRQRIANRTTEVVKVVLLPLIIIIIDVVAARCFSRSNKD